jgi:hypothetical protein
MCNLGNILNYNDTVMAYDLEHINNQEIDDFRNSHPNMPEIIIVKKVFPKYRKKHQKRNWKLKQL